MLFMHLVDAFTKADLSVFMETMYHVCSLGVKPMI